MTDLLFWVFIIQAAWWASALHILTTWKYGDKVWWAPWIGVVNQVPWLVVALVSEQPGILPACIFSLALHLVNAWKWRPLRIALRGPTDKAPGGRPSSRPTSCRHCQARMDPVPVNSDGRFYWLRNYWT